VESAASGTDLSGQWLSLSRTVKRSVRTFRGKLRVMNGGGEAAPSSVFYVYQSQDSAFQDTDLLIGKAKVSSIPAGGHVDVNLRLSAPYDGSKACLIAVLDATDALSETDETNNVIVSGVVQ
jgi:hypothetical protein